MRDLLVIAARRAWWWARAAALAATLTACPQPPPNCATPLVQRCRSSADPARAPEADDPGRPYVCSPAPSHWTPLAPACGPRGLTCREAVPGLAPGASVAACVPLAAPLGVAPTPDPDSGAPDAAGDAP